MKLVKIGLHIWQINDESGFKNSDSLNARIQAIGSYPSLAHNFSGLMFVKKLTI